MRKMIRILTPSLTKKQVADATPDEQPDSIGLGYPTDIPDDYYSGMSPVAQPTPEQISPYRDPYQGIIRSSTTQGTPMPANPSGFVPPYSTPQPSPAVPFRYTGKLPFQDQQDNLDLVQSNLAQSKKARADEYAQTPPQYTPTPFTDTLPGREPNLPIPTFSTRNQDRTGKLVTRLLPLALLGGSGGLQALAAFGKGKQGAEEKSATDEYGRALTGYKLDAASKDDTFRTKSDLYQQHLNANKQENANNRQVAMLGEQTHKNNLTSDDAMIRSDERDIVAARQEVSSGRNAALRTNELNRRNLTAMLNNSSKSGKVAISAKLNENAAERKAILGGEPDTTPEFVAGDLQTKGEQITQKSAADVARDKENNIAKSLRQDKAIKAKGELAQAALDSRESIAGENNQTKTDIANLNYRAQIHRVSALLSQAGQKADVAGLMESRKYLDTTANLYKKTTDTIEHITTRNAKLQADQNADPELKKTEGMRAAIDISNIKKYSGILKDALDKGRSEIYDKANAAVTGAVHHDGTIQKNDWRTIEDNINAYDKQNPVNGKPVSGIPEKQKHIKLSFDKNGVASIGGRDTVTVVQDKKP